ncbi:glycerol-3-phosphate dehydrogenase subunit GlpB [Tessaracoccus antarcticus]|uniref:Glycerol-3-phosphate dehydrogenase subunit GlpB n=2 Tax=Tessaracoccus antarcticus TaxID=2479848 RepID=A0A3M0G5I0_9ACTN|nr:glycerol-3-phosphate dehydrogenase subunit GlpB [Tessaracoccus antarcticus]
MDSRAVVVGAGMAGLVSAIRLRQAGMDVTLVTQGIGGIQLGQGTIDVLGYVPERVLGQPLAAVTAYGNAHPHHPYAILSADDVRAGVEFLRALLPDTFVGDLERNYLLPTAIGALRPTALPQVTMAEGECTPGKQMVFVGLRQLKDFWPELVAGNVARTELPGGGRVSTRAAWLDLPARANEVDSTPLYYARAMDDPAYRKRFVDALRRVVEPGETVGLPGVLGLADRGAFADITAQLGQPVFEISTIPPSVPGMRLNDALTRLAKDARVKVVLGSQVLCANIDGGRIRSLTVGTTGRPTEYAGEHFVFAPGGFESGGIELDSYMKVSEPTLGLPLWVPEGDLVVADHNAAQPLFSVGVRFDHDMRVLDTAGDTVHENLHVAGGILAGASRWQEKSGDGIALASAVRAADAILESVQNLEGARNA